MDIRELLKEFMVTIYDTGYYAGKGEDTREQHQKALTRRTALKQQIEAEFDRLNNKSEDVVSAPLKRGFTTHNAPHMEIILAIDVASYLYHYREQEGEPGTLTEQLKRDVLRGLSEVRFDTLAQEIILRQEASNLGMSVPIRDPYQENTADTAEEIEACEG